MDPSLRIVWIDTELTGLNFDKDLILEIACVITEENLDIVDQVSFVVHQSQEILDKMNSWCIENHAKSGLTEDCLKSTITIEHVDEQLFNFVKQHVPKGKGCVAGNSVYMDKVFVMKQLPKFDSYLHYRIIDVSSLKELCRRWRSEDFKKVPNKALAHRSLEDILESINELKYYKQILFDK